MKLIPAALLIAAATVTVNVTAQTTDLHIALAGSGPLERKTVSFSCDAAAPKLGLPGTRFQVLYINGLGNSLAILPINKQTLIFSTIPSASGSRYAAQQYEWSDGGSRGAFLSTTGLGPHLQTLCKMLP